MLSHADKHMYCVFLCIDGKCVYIALLLQERICQLAVFPPSEIYNYFFAILLVCVWFHSAEMIEIEETQTRLDNTARLK